MYSQPGSVLCASSELSEPAEAASGTAPDARRCRLLGIDTLTVASLNLHCGYGSLGKPFDVVAALGELDAEVICVQEAWTPTSGETVTADGADGAADRPADAADGTHGAADRPADAADGAADRPADAADGTHGCQTASRMESQALADAARKLGAVLLRVPMCTRPSGARAGVPADSVPGELSIAVEGSNRSPSSM